MIKAGTLFCAVLSALLVAATAQVSAFEVVPTGKPNEFVKWGVSKMAGSGGGVVTWGFLAAGTPGSSYCGVYCEGKSFESLPNFYPNPESNNTTSAVALVSLQQVIQSAFDTWSSVADIHFRYVGVDTSMKPINDPTSTSPMLRVGAYAFGGFVAFFTAGAAFPPQPNAATGGGCIFCNTNVGYQLATSAEGTRLQDSPVGGGLHMTDVYLLALHEIGHVLGLAHSADPDAVMYGGSADPVLIATHMRRGLAADDIAGARFLYGAPRIWNGSKPTP
jgi:hypothetical protein